LEAMLAEHGHMAGETSEPGACGSHGVWELPTPMGRLWKFKASQVDEWVQAGCAAAKPVRAKTGKAAERAKEL